MEKKIKKKKTFKFIISKIYLDTAFIWLKTEKNNNNKKVTVYVGYVHFSICTIHVL